MLLMVRKKASSSLSVYRPAEVLDGETLFRPAPLLPGEDANAHHQLQAALMAQHAPQTAYQKLLVTQLFELEWNIRRRAAWASELIAGRAAEEAVRRLTLSGMAKEKARETVDAWRAETGMFDSEASRTLEAHGIRPSTLIAEARAALHDLLSDFDAETRRSRQEVRLLQADLAGLKRQCQSIPDAQYADGS